MIGPLSDFNKFRQRRDDAWAKNGNYWLSEPLRHVVDVGQVIVEKINRFCAGLPGPAPVIVDMGCGSCWLLEMLLQGQQSFRYVGVDNNSEFIKAAEETFATIPNASFLFADLDMRVDLDLKADLVINAFNFFELADLDRGMANAASWLAPEGRLLMSTIDKTYLILALSTDWEEFRNNLKSYQLASGIKYDFQKVDLGDRLSGELEYPSVLYNTQNFIESAKSVGLSLVSYTEDVFTARAVPKIYCHLEFGRIS